MLLAIQDLLDNPNPKSPAQSDAYEAFVKRPAEYKRKIKEQTARNPPSDS